MDFISMIYITFLLAATVSAYKIVKIGGYATPGSTIIYPFTFFLANIYTECYGAYLTKKLIYKSVLCGMVFALLLTGINILPSPNFWNHNKEYNQVLGNILRFTMAGIIGYVFGAMLNNYLFNLWKYKWNGKFFWARSLLATSISEGLVTYSVGFITFYGLIPITKIFLLMTNAFILKFLYGLIAVGPTGFIVFMLKKLINKNSNNDPELYSV